jgi:polyhydroxybutyrate depolymerase
MARVYIASVRTKRYLPAAAILGIAIVGGVGISRVPSAAAAAAVPTQASKGCTSATAPNQGQQNVDFSAAGDTGSYIVETPPDTSAHHPLPLVVDLHGYEESAAIQVDISGLGAYGATKGFITVTPQVNQTVPHWDQALGSADLKFLGDLLTHVTNTLCVDRHRVFVAGYSNGAFMTSSLVCNYADEIAAVATVAGMQAPPGCRPSRPVPVIAFHGTADPFVPYQGGIGPAAAKLTAPDGHGTLGSYLGSTQLKGISPSTLPIPTEEARWAARNGCAKTKTQTSVASGVTLVAYHCPSDATVELYRENGDGHIWAGSPFMNEIASLVGKTTSAISANQLMWNFFEHHPR